MLCLGPSQQGNTGEDAMRAEIGLRWPLMPLVPPKHLRQVARTKLTVRPERLMLDEELYYLSKH